MGSKRPKLLDQGFSYYGTTAAASYMYNPPPYSYVELPHHPPVVRLRGLPFDCSEGEIIEFFHGIDLVDVLLVHKEGKFSGEAFCVLAYPFQIDFALQRDRHNIGRRYVEVYKSKRDEYYNAIANEVNDSPQKSIPRARSYDDRKDLAQHTGILRLKGLPYSVTKDDIIKFFMDFALSEGKVHIEFNSAGRPSGDAFVEFANAEESKVAMGKDRKMLGRRYVELFPSTREELDAAISRSRESGEDGKNSSEKGAILRMRGLPYSAAKEDIIDFFYNFKLSEDSIHLISNSKGRASGEAFVEFASPEDADAAMAKDRMTLGSRYVELFPSSLEDLNDSLSRSR